MSNLKISFTLKLLSIAAFILRKEYQHSVNSNRQTFLKQYDFIVVGSGSAGAIVAHRLAQNSQINVLLLEAGGPNSLSNDIPAAYGTAFNTDYDWNYTLAKQFVGLAFVDQRIPENRGHVLGGSSSINGMIFNRGNRKGFDQWEREFGAVGWSFKNILQYFIKYENNTDPEIVANGYHGTSGPIQVTSIVDPEPMILIHKQALNDLGFEDTDINGPVQEGTSLIQTTIDARGIRSSTANAYLDPNPFSNLHILTRAFVTKVLFDKSTAIGVQFVKHGKTYNVRARREVILSAGVINTPQILMLSGIGPRKQLEHLGIPVLANLPVGEHLQSHPSMNINFLVKDKYQNLVRDGDLTIDRLYTYSQNRTDGLGIKHSSLTYLSTSSNPDTDWPNICFQAVATRFVNSLDDMGNYQLGARRQEWDIHYKNFFGKNIIYADTLLERPRSFGYVKLVSSDPFVYPTINPLFLTNGQDFQDFVELIRFTFNFYERSSIAQYLEPHKPIPGCKFCPNQRFVYECDSYIICYIKQLVYSSYHPVGTCRMGAINRDDTVVGPRLLVKYIKNLRVCDASVMPLVTNGNTNAPTMMIGEKCADLIKEDNRLPHK